MLFMTILWKNNTLMNNIRVLL